MSDLPARREQVSFPNPGILHEKWYHDSHSRLGRFAPSLPLIGGAIGAAVVVAALIVNHPRLSGMEETGILLGIGFWPGLLIFAGIWKLIVDSVSRRKKKYRRENAQLLIDALAERGWVAYGDDPVQHLVEDDYPYFYNKQFRYKTYNKVIDDKSVEWNFELADDKAEELYRDDEKARRIERLTSAFDEISGPLSQREKEAIRDRLAQEL